MAAPQWQSISPDEFAAKCADYGLEVRSAGSRWWILTPEAPRHRGELRSAAEAIAFVEGYRTNDGVQILEFKVSTTSERHVKIGYSRAGYLALQTEERSQRAWARRIGGVPRRELVEGP